LPCACRPSGLHGAGRSVFGAWDWLRSFRPRASGRGLSGVAPIMLSPRAAVSGRCIFVCTTTARATVRQARARQVPPICISTSWCRGSHSRRPRLCHPPPRSRSGRRSPCRCGRQPADPARRYATMRGDGCDLTQNAPPWITSDRGDDAPPQRRHAATRLRRSPTTRSLARRPAIALDG